jgi:hypothetical protein
MDIVKIIPETGIVVPYGEGFPLLSAERTEKPLPSDSYAHQISSTTTLGSLRAGCCCIDPALSVHGMPARAECSVIGEKPVELPGLMITPYREILGKMSS